MAETVRIEIPIETIDDTEPELSNLIKKLGKAGKEADKFGESADKARQKVSKFDETQEKTQKSLSRWMKEKYEILLEAKERITPVLQALGGRLKGIAGKTWRVSMRAVDMVTAPVRGILNLLKNPIFQAGAVLGISIGLKDTVDTYKDFEAAMSKVQAVSGATATEMVKLNAKAEEMGAATKFTATESAEAFNYMAMAGWKTKDMLDGIEGILNLAAASGEDLATTSDIVTDALTAFGLQAKDSGHFADVLAQASSNANTNVGMMGESFKYIAPVAGAMKYSVEDVSLALGLMANASVKSSMAGTSLKTALVNMAKPTDAMAMAMEKYHISLTDKGGKMKTLKGVLDNLRGSLGKLSEAEQTAAAGTIFGKEAMAGMLSIINASERDYNKLTKAVNNADGASADMAGTMLDNLEGSITLFQSALDGVKISLGKRLAPYVRSAADWLKDAMPEVQEALGQMMDWVDRKAEQLKNKFREISLGADWQTSDFFGKAQILWDKFISEPFSEWWNSTGKAKIADALGNFGELLGSGLHAGIMTLFGIDMKDTTSEAVSIGRQFAKGFSDGFDFGEISRKLWEGLGNMVKNAGKLLPGGQQADLSSLLSAAMLAKIAGPLVSTGKGAWSVGSALFGSGGAGSILKKGLGSFSLEAELAGVGNATGTGLAGVLGNLGMSMGATTSAGSVALGAGTVLGGAVGAAGLIHGGMDLYEGYNSEDAERAAVYKKAGAVEVGGTLGGAGAGATIGAGIGAVFGGVGAVPGALIGAGVGAIGSWIYGNKIKEDYEEELEERQKALAKQEKAYAVLGRDIDDVKFKSDKLNQAMHDTETSTEDFVAMYQEAVADNLKSHFGDVSLSLEEIKKTADSVVFGGQKKQFEDFAEAAGNTASSLDELKGSMTELNKQNWRAGLHTKMDDEEIVSYQTAMDNFASSAEKYLANSHYETTLSVELLLGKKGSKDITKGFDKTYTGMEESLEKLSKSLSRKVEKALEDGVINSKEQKAITALQKKIAGITDKISSAKERASRDALKTKYSKGNIDAESFDSLQQELAADSQQKAQDYYDALQSGYTALELRKENGSISGKEYRKEHNRLDKAYQKNMNGLTSDTVDFQLDFITETYNRKLDEILPGMKGTTKKKLKKVLNEAFAFEPDYTLWDDADIVRWFGLDKLDGETQGAIASMIRSTAASIPEDQKKTMEDKVKKSIPTVKEIMEKVDFSRISAEDYYKMLGYESPSSAIGTQVMDFKFEPLLTGRESNYEKSAKEYAKQIHESLKNNMNPEQIHNFVEEYMTGAVSSVDKDAAEAANEAGKKVGDSTIDSASKSISSGSDILRNALDNTVATASPITPTVQVNPNYVVTPFDRSQFESTGGNQGGGSKGKDSKGGLPLVGPSPSPTPDRKAAGGYVGSKRLSWLAEEGWGEYIIPTNPSRRGRALELYEQAGRALGVQKHAAGGFVGRDMEYSELASYAKENGDALNFITEGGKEVPGDYSGFMGGNDGEEGKAYSADSQDGNSSPNISVNVQMNPEFTISGSGGQDEEQIAESVRRHILEMADELGGEIASRLQDVFSNMPTEEA